MPKVSYRDREVLYGELNYYPGSAHPQNFTYIHDVTSVCQELKCKSRMSYNNFNNQIFVDVKDTNVIFWH